MNANRRGENAKKYPYEYGAWASMKQRCKNPRSQMWYLYGARGISYDKSWEFFDNFIRDMGRKPKGKVRQYSIDRIDNNKNYGPLNCRWSSSSEQSFNKRNNRLLYFEGKDFPMAKWGKILGFEKGVISSRLRYGWSIREALSRPVRKYTINL